MSHVTAFLGEKQIAAGDAAEVRQAIEDGYSAADHAVIQVFDDGSGRAVDLDYWDAAQTAEPARGRGRPKMGVTSREVTLLPRHWDWLSRQRGGASATLRRLVEDASRQEGGEAARRDAVYRFMHAVGGDRPGYEEALRALYRGDRALFDRHVGDWPEAFRNYIERLFAAA